MKKKSRFSTYSTRHFCFRCFSSLIPSAFLLGIVGGILAALAIVFLTQRFFRSGDSDDVLLVQVDGNSMLPFLCGGTIFETCPKCLLRAPRSDYGASVCPNCGWMVHEKIRSSKSYLQKSRQKICFGDLLEVVPQEKYEWDDLVVATPSEKIGPVVKRIVGLPGDRLEVQNGVLYRNGQRAVHSLEAWKQMRILVFSDDFRPDGVSRWIPVASSALSSSASQTVSNDLSHDKVSKWVRLLTTPQSQSAGDQNALFSKSQSAEDSASPSSSGIPGIVCLPDGWRFDSPDPRGIKYVHQTGRFVSTSDGRVFCRLEPAPITNYRAENGTQFPSRSIGMIHELLCAFELTGIRGTSSDFRLIVSLPTLPGKHFFVLIPQSEKKTDSELKTEFQEMFATNPTLSLPSVDEELSENQTINVSFFRMEKEMSLGTTFPLLFSTLDGLPRLTVGEAPLREFLTFSLSPSFDSESRSASAVVSDAPFSISATNPSQFLSQQLPTENLSAPPPASVKIWRLGNLAIEIRHLQLFRGEYWEKNLTKFHKFTQKEKKTLAFNCESEYYLIGDNFFVSEDSRHWGTVPHAKIHGKVILPGRTAPKTKRNAVSNFNTQTPCSTD